MKDTCPDDDQGHSYNSKDTRTDEETEEKDGEAKEAPIKSKKLSKEGEGINVSCKSDGSENAEVKSQDAMELTSGEQLNGGDAGTKKAMSQWTKTKKDTLQIRTMIMNPKMRIMRESVR